VLPWPVERVRRVSTERVRTVPIGHEEDALPDELLTALDPGDADGLDEEDALLGARAGDAESRLWAKQHADQEYTLLLGDGRDLITIDALVHYRVRDARAWLYGMQNPEAALRSLAYRAVMERIISQTLDDALGQDFAALAADLEGRIQAEADRHTLGVQVVDVTLGALHPPVGVAADYQGVVSAQILRDTDRIAAEAYRTGRLSEARREVLRDAASAGAFAAERHADAVGEARAFLGLRARVRTAEADYRFRRRMEAMAQNLEGRPVVILDHRLERDGMAIWMQSGR
jgi:regulator of protease activity HflC (stomatin/prohibitin superfamily)